MKPSELGMPNAEQTRVMIAACESALIGANSVR
jgi:hypothetical protein